MRLGLNCSVVRYRGPFGPGGPAPGEVPPLSDGADAKVSLQSGLYEEVVVVTEALSDSVDATTALVGGIYEQP